MDDENNNKLPKGQYQWEIADDAPAELFEKFPELEKATVRLLHNRELTTQEDVDAFLNPDYAQDQHDPFLFRDMRKAVNRIKAAIEAKEKIVIHGDYDADGVCASGVLYTTLKEIGADVEVYLPHRDTEGYGLNMNTVQNLADVGTNLIITVDCGISNKPEVEKAAELGMDVIVTDHHSEPPELPDAAIAILDAKLEGETYPFEYLAGVGVAFKVSQALIAEYDLGEAFEKWLLDMVAISTVTDFVELVGENRVLLKYGLVVLQKNRRPGLRQLFKKLKVDASTADTDTIGFKIGPPINAAGRVKHANEAFEMLIAPDDEKAAVSAAELERTNRERQALSRKMADDAMVQAAQQADEQVIVVHSEDWPVGLVGLVAGKVSSEYGRPAFVITKMNGEIVGSGRSIEQFNLVDGLQSMEELFTKYGGHPMACGFSLKDNDSLDEFIKRFRERGRDLLEGQDLRKTLRIEAMLTLDKVNWQLVDVLEQFAPFGQANPKPPFLSRGVEVASCRAVGKKEDHLKIAVTGDGVRRDGIAFGLGAWANQLEEGDTIDVAYNVGVNEWNGNREIQLEILDIQKP